MIMAKAVLLFLLHSAFLLTKQFVRADPAAAVPVLFWSPERSMSDLSSESTNGIVEADSFMGSFISPLMIKTHHSAVVFLQDKLHMDDFTKYADVYSVDSTGGSFKNVKNLMEENFSLELGQVSGAFSAVTELQKRFKGAVHTVSSMADLKGLHLEEKFLLLVRLAPISGSLKEEAVIADNDKMIGEVCEHLKHQGIKYAALYTGKKASESPLEEGEVHNGRHLLANLEEENSNGTLMNVSAENSNMFIFMRSMDVVVMNKGQNIINKFQIIPESTSAQKSTKNNKTAEVLLEFSKQKDNITSETYEIGVTLNVKNEGDRWVVSSMKLRVEPSVPQPGSNKTDIKNGTLANNELDLMVPILYSFHCTWMKLFLQTVGVKNQEYKNFTGTYVKIDGFQFQPYMIQGDRFFDSVDCVGFFTLGIWMGLLPVALLLSILLGGVFMLLGLSIMDKYDDPKGKTITVAVGSD